MPGSFIVPARAVIGWMLVVAALALAGCARATLVAALGPIANGEHLITLIVSNDLNVVRTECGGLTVFGPILGCQKSTPASAVDRVRVVTVVRYAETLPSARTFEIDAHELCHALAAVQPVTDSCHAGNGGVVRSRSAWDFPSAP